MSESVRSAKSRAFCKDRPFPYLLQNAWSAVVTGKPPTSYERIAQRASQAGFVKNPSLDKGVSM
ncbi:MAG: hypothetical protein ACRESZ_15090, partial [Methylococcales bacterium]